MKEPKVLIAAPIGGKKQYSMGIWLQWIANQSYKNYDVAVCVNGKYSEELLEKLVKSSWIDSNKQEKRILPMVLNNSEKLTTIQRITYSREKLRRYALENNYDYLFFLDTDTIPANKNAIQLLIDRKKEVVSGLYFYKNSKQTVVIDLETHTNVTLAKCENAAKMRGIFKVWGFGFGCLMLDLSSIATLPFDYSLFGEERTDDFGYCHILEQASIDRWLDPFVLCKHFDTPENEKKINTLFNSSIKTKD